MNNIISFSGGKDSTAMVLEMLERGENIHSVVAFDTGWEFPQMLEHWEEFERYTGLEIVKLYPKHDFTHSLFTREIKKRDGTTRKGNDWPTPIRRWCTREKLDSIDKYMRQFEKPVSCIGFAADEQKRAAGQTVNAKKYRVRFPLIEWDIDEAQALQICKRHGFTYGGLYEHFDRVSCFCCPLQRIGELRSLRKYFPEQWNQMLEWEKGAEHTHGFRGYDSVHDLERRFAEEDKQGELFG
jgi:3'-phosphoadenosine 5'-phosphosulfate sulfotransferase (PAPS reductase)/FAD synthetase